MVDLPHPGNPVFELDVAAEAQFRRRGGHGPDVVGLHSSSDQNGGGPFFDGIAEVELELTDLVAAHCEPRAVVPLHEQAWPAQEPGEVGHGLQWSWPMGQLDPREVREWTHTPRGLLKK